RATGMPEKGNALYEWRDHLLNVSTANFLLKEDRVVPKLQSTIANIEDGIKFSTAFARLATRFAVPREDKDLLRCLRATLQILIIYSMTYGDHYWTTSPAIKEIKRLSIRLQTLLFKNLRQEIPLEDKNASIDTYVYLASLLDKAVAMYSLHRAIIRQLYKVANLIPLALPFRQYKPDDAMHVKNATSLLTKLYPETHYMTGMAFALVINPIPSNTRYKDSPPKYELEKEEECCLIDI
ncbi:MAG: hypothetical protein Q9190_006966, partial [Brigantiaea leucoxantha]